MNLVASGQSIAVRGNHDDALLKALSGDKVRLDKRLKRTISSITRRGEEFVRRVRTFLAHMPCEFEYNQELKVVHAAAQHGAAKPIARKLALFGGESKVNSAGRIQGWATQYQGPHRVLVVGHRTVDKVTRVKAASGTQIYFIDTGCVFGGQLTALRYPELTVVQVRRNRKQQ